MSEIATRSDLAGNKHGQFRAAMMYHPSHHVPDLGEAESWYQRVFGRPSTPLSAIALATPTPGGYPTDYSMFTPISDVLLDTIEPQRYVLRGVQRYATVDQPHLGGLGWYVDGIAELYRTLQSVGIRVVSQLAELADGDAPPTAAGSTMPLFFTVPEDAGLRHQLIPRIPFPLDPRVRPDWVLPPVSDRDPLGIDRCSHHTVLTDRPDRALRLLVDVFGGSIVHQGRDEVRGATSTYVHLADSVLEYAVPDDGTPAHADWTVAAPNDTYHAITWKVADLDRVERHLRAEGVQIRARAGDTLVTDPATSLGIPWGFTTRLAPGDPRQGSR